MNIKLPIQLTHDSDGEIRACRVSLVVSGDTGVRGGVLFPLKVADDQCAVGEDTLAIIEG